MAHHHEYRPANTSVYPEANNKAVPNKIRPTIAILITLGLLVTIGIISMTVHFNSPINYKAPELHLTQAQTGSLYEQNFKASLNQS